MKHGIFTSQLAAKILERVTSHLHDLPLEGRDIGGGIHVPPEMSRTERIYDIRKHPTLAKWSHPIPDELVERIKARRAAIQERLGLTDAQWTALEARLDAAADLDSTWEPTDQIA